MSAIGEITSERYVMCNCMRYRAALEEIRANHGHVCAEFETCKHVGCNDSYASWEIANQALQDVDMPTKRVCFRCGTPVEIETKILEYPYYCPECDENMFEFETREEPNQSD
jgi:predicted RNA-binding Zn-ribbon protein involved in translation (DUF1610 family)